jgi:hypothetical protein
MKRLFRDSFFVSLAVIAANSLYLNSAIAGDISSVTPMTATTSVETLTTKERSPQLAQVTSVSQLSDVQPTDWAFQALQSLVERYGCIAGYPDGTYRGNRALTRYEFAAGLNACLDRVNELIATASADMVNKEDLATLQRLQEEFGTELATLRGRVDALEATTAELEANQFSTTTKLSAQVIMAASDTFGDDVEDNTVLQTRMRFNFLSSFTGTDQLQVRLQAGNFSAFDYVGNITNEGQIAYATGTDNDVVIDNLNYSFQVGDNLRVWLLANSGEYDDVFDIVDNLITDTNVGAIGNLSFNPIYNAGGQNAGIITEFSITEALKLGFGYQAGNAEDPAPGNGLFNGSNSFLGRLEYGTDRFKVAFAYLHTYDEALNTTEQGSIRSLVEVTDADGSTRSVVGNHYGVEAQFDITPGIRIGGWAGLSKAIVLGLGDADVWNYALSLSFPDLGKEGNLLNIIVAVEPKLTGTSGFTVADGDGVERRRDPDTGLHVEASYRYQLTDNISVAPGVIWLTAPGHDSDNSDIVVGTLRTTFEF